MTADSPLRGATRDIAAVAREVSTVADERALDDVLGRVRAQVEQHRATRGRRAAVWSVGLVAAVILVIATWRAVVGGQQHVPLSYRVAGAETQRDGYIRALPGEHPRVSFSEGSVVALADGARMRVVSVDELGGRLAIEEGEVRADIVHRPGARWAFEAGPYSVHVRGTSFSLVWRGADGFFDLRLQTGLLEIHIPWATTPIVIHGGQRLTVRSSDHRVTIGESNDASQGAEPLEVPPEAVSGAALAPSAALPVPPPAASSSPSTLPKERPASWSERMASGALQSIIDEAVEHGLEATVRERSSEDLEVLEAAARYQKHPDIARRALLAQRSRFAGSARAKEAAFLLGRIAETGDGVAAHEWYERYLSEAPNGAFAAEAMGRNMIVTNRIFGIERARPMAQAYLKRWPTGAHAKLAHSLADGP